MTRRILVFGIALLLGVALAPRAQAQQVSPEKREAIRQLIRSTGVVSVGEQMAGALVEQLKPAFPSVPDALWAELTTEVDEAEWIELVTPIYARHFTLEDLRGLAAFYETPLGQKAIRALPAITQESMRAGESWGQAKAREFIEKLESQGYARET